MLRRTLLFICLLSALGSIFLSPTANAQTTWSYIDPRPNAEFVSAGATIALRQGEDLDPASVQSLNLSVTGTTSGAVRGAVKLADDRQTLIFTPQHAFAPGETIRVSVPGGVRTASGAQVSALSYSFEVTHNRAPIPIPNAELDGIVPPSTQPAPHAAGPFYVTGPVDLPRITINAPANGTDEGYLFLADWDVVPGVRSYMMILDDNAEPIFYKAGTGNAVFDFKVQPTGQLTFWDVASQSFLAMDNTYKVVGSYKAGNGYPTDFHELFVEPNGHAWLMIYDAQTVDMSAVVPGGKPNATVIGLVIQELDVDGNVVFQWRSWDHFQLTDSYEDLTTTRLDPVHGNSIEITNDGNVLISSRHMSEITKINRTTGAIIWRFGGKNNQFTLQNGQLFSYQHDARQLPNGNYTVFDNGNQHIPPSSRGAEFQLNEQTMQATQVWAYHHAPDVYGSFVGSNQRLPNGNSLISWGAQPKTVTEVRPDGTVALDFSLQHYTYRAFRQKWEGNPQQPPDLVVVPNQSGKTRLFYSWNGATEVVAYRVYAGPTADTLNVVETRPRTSFETSSSLARSDCYFKVEALDKDNNVLGTSHVVQDSTVVCLPEPEPPTQWFVYQPQVVRP